MATAQASDRIAVAISTEPLSVVPSAALLAVSYLPLHLEMPKRNLLKVIAQLKPAPVPKRQNVEGCYDPNGWWHCSWQGKYGSAGTLDGCIEMVSNYILSELERDFLKLSRQRMKQRLKQVKRQCLTTGKAGSEDWWDIWYVGDDN